MNTKQTVTQDERTTAVANASYRWAYTVLVYALLADVAYRGLVRNEAAWDLLAMVLAGGAVAIAYQIRWRALGSRLSDIAGIILLGGLLGALSMFVLRYLR